jgi:hypothetical protein
VRDRARPHRHAERGERRPAAAPAAPDVLAALRQAGNQATGRALARARDEAGKATQRYTMEVAGIGEIAIRSWQLRGPHEIEVVFAEGPAGPALQRAASSGEPIASVVIRRGGQTVTLSDVLVTRFSLANDPGGPALVTVGFQGAALEVQ